MSSRVLELFLFFNPEDRIDYIEVSIQGVAWPNANHHSSNRKPSPLRRVVAFRFVVPSKIDLDGDIYEARRKCQMKPGWEIDEGGLWGPNAWRLDRRIDRIGKTYCANILVLHISPIRSSK